MSDPNLLREMRQQANVSQRRLAAHLGMSNTALMFWEREAPTVERIERYHRALREIASPPLSELELRYAHGDR